MIADAQKTRRAAGDVRYRLLLENSGQLVKGNPVPSRARVALAGGRCAL